MKKITLLACACALFLAPAVNAQEVQYVEDPAQGYIFNRMQDNWFVQVEGGIGVMLSAKDNNMKIGKRILSPKGNLFIGKWFSPLLGVRIGGHFEQMKGATDATGKLSVPGYRTDMGDQMKSDAERGILGQKFNRIGITGDVLFNVTNWICGYKPGRFYNATVYAGASASWNYYNDNPNGSGTWKYAGGSNGQSRNFALQAGLLNSFALGKHVDLLLDLRFDMIQEHTDGYGHKNYMGYPSAQLGFAYKFGKSEWNAPVVPICPTVDDSWKKELDALRNKLAQANAKIRDLENQLNDCLNWKKNHVCSGTGNSNAPRPAEAPLATIYYPRGKSYITPVQMEVVNAVADVMNNERDNYTLTGWADNYTGNDEINIKLRHDRVNGVKNTLVGKGISDSRLSTETNNANHPDVYGAQSAPLGRCVTIVRNK